jgi:predicted hydrolase (HD superfamily)
MQENIPHQIALDLLHKNMQSLNLRRHCYAVSVVMRALYRYIKGTGSTESSIVNLSEEDWGVVGLLHDADYESTKDSIEKHTVVLLDWLSEYNLHGHIIDAFKSHNNRNTKLKEPETLLDWSLECCDELTGFIVACPAGFFELL